MKYICKICGFIYDDSKEKVPFDKLPETWVCPVCGAPKSLFEPLEESENTKNDVIELVEIQENADDMQKLSIAEMSALCSNLARGCEKQYKFEEMELFNRLADYFSSITPPEQNANVENITKLINEDLEYGFKAVDEKAKSAGDRGALRVKVWSEKVTNMLKNILDRYQNDGDKILENTSIWVCTICGFVYIGENPPEICPVCKVPNWKFEKIEGRA